MAQYLFSSRSEMSAFNSSNFVFGSQMISAIVSSSITRNVSIGVGLSNLSVAISTFKLSNLMSSLYKLLAHSSESGAPRIRKSSR